MCDSGTDQTTSSTTQSTSLTGPAKAAYDLAFQKAQEAASSSYNPNTNTSVAGFTSPQTQAFDNVQSTQGIQTPYIGQSSAYTASGAAPISAEQIQHYMDPNVQNVIDATQRDFDVQNQRQQSGVVGNARMQGSWGGDREAVAQALTAEAQNRVQNPVLAKLRSDAYTQALGAATGDQQRRLAASGQSLAQGQAAGAANQTDLANLYASGGLQQGQNQKVLDAATTNAKQEEAFKYQQPQYLAGITGALGGFGTTTTGNSVTTPQQPNEWMQAAGLGLGALAALADGGRVDGFADGGTVPFGGVSYIPTMPAGGGFHAPAMSMPQASAAPADTGLLGHMKDVMGAAQQFKGAGAGVAKIGDMMRTTTSPNEGTAFANPISTTVTPTGLDGNMNYLGNSTGMDLSGISSAFAGLATGGAVPQYDTGGEVPAGIMVGAMPDIGLSPEVLSLAGLDVPREPIPVVRGATDSFTAGPDKFFYPGDPQPASFGADAPTIKNFDPGRSVQAQSGMYINNEGDQDIPGPNDLPPMKDVGLTAPPMALIGAPYQAPAPATAGIAVPAPAHAPPAKSETRGSALGQILSTIGIDPNVVDSASGKQGVLAMAASLMSGSAPGGKGLGGFLRPLGVAAQQGLTTANARSDKDIEIAHRAQQLQQEAARLALSQAKSPYEIEHLKAQTDQAKTAADMDLKRLASESKKGRFITDAMGRIIDTQTGQVQGGSNYDAGLTGEDFLKTLPPEIRSQVKAIADYGQSPMNGARGTHIMNAVAQYKPEYDAKQYPKVQQIMKDFSPSGQTGKGITATNVALHHADLLEKSIDTLDNYSTLPSVANPLRRLYQTQSGNKEYQAAIGEFNQQREHLATELDKALKGGGTTDVAGIQGILRNFNPDLPPAELKGAIRGAIQLLGARLGEIKKSYKDGMGMDAKEFEPLNHESQMIYDRIVNGKKQAEPSIRDQILKLPDGPVQLHGKQYMKNGTILTPIEAGAP
jgi:hypothetical protein